MLLFCMHKARTGYPFCPDFYIIADLLFLDKHGQDRRNDHHRSQDDKARRKVAARRDEAEQVGPEKSAQVADSVDDGNGSRPGDAVKHARREGPEGAYGAFTAGR